MISLYLTGTDALSWAGAALGLVFMIMAVIKSKEPPLSEINWFFFRVLVLFRLIVLWPVRRLEPFMTRYMIDRQIWGLGGAISSSTDWLYFLLLLSNLFLLSVYLP
jgi:hypothetical protein